MSVSVAELTRDKQNLPPPDSMWQILRSEAQGVALREPCLSGFLHKIILDRNSCSEALGTHLASKLANESLDAEDLCRIFAGAFAASNAILNACEADLSAFADRDPACAEPLTPFLYYKGFHALTGYRLARQLWLSKRHSLALHLQSRISECFGVDIHPAAQIGKGIMIDHATGVVIGETAVVEDNVSLLHGVTLGGTGKETGDRHPKVRRGSLLSAGATVLGNIEIGECARVGAGSIVLRNVPPYCTAVGVPARLIHCPDASEEQQPALEMDHLFPPEPEYII